MEDEYNGNDATDELDFMGCALTAITTALVNRDPAAKLDVAYDEKIGLNLAWRHQGGPKGQRFYTIPKQKFVLERVVEAWSVNSPCEGLAKLFGIEDLYEKHKALELTEVQSLSAAILEAGKEEEFEKEWNSDGNDETSWVPVFDLADQLKEEFEEKIGYDPRA